MPTNAEPTALNDGAQAVRSLQALAESTRQLDPIDSYYAIRDLLACVRHLSQAAQHIATTHRDNAEHAAATTGLTSDGYILAGSVSAQLDGCRQHLDQARTTLQHAADRSIHIDWIALPRPAAAGPQVHGPEPAPTHELARGVSARPDHRRLL